MNKEDGKKIVDEKTIAREIFGEPSAHYGGRRTDNYSYTQPTSTYGARKRYFWGLDYETREKILRGLGIYFLVIAPVLVVLPPVLIYYHFISTAMNPLWIGLFLVNFIGAMVYYVLTYNEVPKLSLLGEVVLIIYLLLGIVFAAISLPLMYYGYQALTN
ncbi:MAG: hypothetical protein RQ842_09120 [Vulcanisaeta sp.]|nr:hypothetical protein [Vulcanisaeta sp.]